MKRILLLGAAMIVGPMLGCSGGSVKDNQPKAVNPNANPAIQRGAHTPGDAKPVGAMKE